MVRLIMVKRKLSVSLDPGKLKQAQSLVEVDSVSELLDVALARLIEEELERRHVDLARPIMTTSIGQLFTASSGSGYTEESAVPAPWRSVASRSSR
jgi:hypothetical protein